MTSLFVAASELLLRREYVSRDFLLEKADLFTSTRGANAIFGDSRAWYGLTGIPGFVNNAFGGDSIFDTGEKIRWYFRGRTGFRTIIAFSPDNFTAKPPKGEEFRELARDIYNDFFFHEADSQPSRLFFFSDYYRVRIFKIWETWLRKGDFSGPFRLSEDGANLAAGQMEMPSDAALGASIDIARGNVRELAKFPTSPAARYLRDLFDWLKEREAAVCVVTPPPFHLYSDPLSGSREYRAFFEVFQQEVEGRGFRYINYFWNELPVTDFADAFHLNADGARRFSAQVARDCA
jgi:hypothetical protein